jgi:hypothetical protein
MWLLKSFGMHTSLVLDTAKSKLNGVPILLAKGALELRFRNMGSKYVRSTFAIRHILDNTGGSNKLRGSYERDIRSTSTLDTIQRLPLKRRSRLRLRRSKFRSINIRVTRNARIQTLSTKTLASCAQNLILKFEALTSTTCHISQIINLFFNALSICGTQEFSSRLALISLCSTNLALISSRIFFKAKTSLSESMQEVQMRPHEQVSSFTSTKAHHKKYCKHPLQATKSTCYKA